MQIFYRIEKLLFTSDWTEFVSLHFVLFPFLDKGRARDGLVVIFHARGPCRSRLWRFFPPRPTGGRPWPPPPFFANFRHLPKFSRSPRPKYSRSCSLPQPPRK